MDPESRSESIVRFQRTVVQEILGKIPETEFRIDPTEGTCESLVACARSLAEVAMGGDGDVDESFEGTVLDAVELYALAVSAVRWSECPLSAEEPDAPSRMISMMMSRTMTAPLPVKTLANEFRLAPYRAPEVVRYRRFCHGGKVDFDEWESDSGDPEYVRMLASVTRGS